MHPNSLSQRYHTICILSGAYEKAISHRKCLTTEELETNETIQMKFSQNCLLHLIQSIKSSIWTDKKILSQYLHTSRGLFHSLNLSKLPLRFFALFREKLLEIIRKWLKPTSNQKNHTCSFETLFWMGIKLWMRGFRIKEQQFYTISHRIISLHTNSPFHALARVFFYDLYVPIRRMSSFHMFFFIIFVNFFLPYQHLLMCLFQS